MDNTITSNLLLQKIQYIANEDTIGPTIAQNNWTLKYSIESTIRQYIWTINYKIQSTIAEYSILQMKTPLDLLLVGYFGQ